MKVFFSKAATAINIFMTSSNRHKRKWVICCRIALTIMAIIVLSTYLRKIYEVPVNYTEFHVVRSGLLEKGDLHYFLIRDYDREKVSSDNLFRRKSKYNGGIYVEGVFYNRDTSAFHTNSNITKSDAWIRRNSEILDTAHYLKTIRNAVYVMIKGTRRQTMVLDSTTREMSKEYLDATWVDTTDYFHYGVFDSISYSKDSIGQTHISVLANKVNNKYCHREVWKIPIDTLFYYSRLRDSKNGFCRELHLYASRKDNSIPVFTDVTGDPFERPNPLIVAEDVSKMVEIIRIPVSSTHFVKSLTIDYRCPADFGTLVPEPDEKTMSSIRYTDTLKIQKIAWDGLRYHVRFSDMENIQEVRIFTLTTLITILATILCSLIYKLTSSWLNKRWRKYPKAFIFFIISICLLIYLYIKLFNYTTDVDYKNLYFDTLDNGIEWQNYN